MHSTSFKKLHKNAPAPSTRNIIAVKSASFYKNKQLNSYIIFATIITITSITTITTTNTTYAVLLPLLPLLLLLLPLLLLLLLR